MNYLSLIKEIRVVLKDLSSKTTRKILFQIPEFR